LTVTRLLIEEEQELIYLTGEITQDEFPDLIDTWGKFLRKARIALEFNPHTVRTQRNYLCKPKRKPEAPSADYLDLHVSGWIEEGCSGVLLNIRIGLPVARNRGDEYGRNMESAALCLLKAAERHTVVLWQTHALMYMPLPFLRLDSLIILLCELSERGRQEGKYLWRIDEAMTLFGVEKNPPHRGEAPPVDPEPRLPVEDLLLRELIIPKELFNGYISWDQWLIGIVRSGGKLPSIPVPGKSPQAPVAQAPTVASPTNNPPSVTPRLELKQGLLALECEPGVRFAPESKATRRKRRR
jgi:hypothetical protein